jgi:hypothetical protein
MDLLSSPRKTEAGWTKTTSTLAKQENKRQWKKETLQSTQHGM